MLEGWKRTAAILIALASLLFAGSFFIPAMYEICAKNEYTDAKECAQHHLGPFALFWIVEIIDAHNELVTALATFAIAAFTIVLANVTGRLAQLTKESGDIAKDTLILGNRAFVVFKQITALYTFDNTKLPDQVIIGWAFSPTWENSGNTQTKNMRAHVDHELRDTALPEGFQFIDRNSHTGRQLLGPRTTSRLGQTRMFSIDELRQVQAGTSFLYIWGGSI